VIDHNSGGDDSRQIGRIPWTHGPNTFRIAFALASLLVLAACDRQPAPLPIHGEQVIPLWTHTAPGALGTEATDIPALTVFLPRTMRPHTPAVIICPGGGYVQLAVDHEGRQVAQFLNSLGLVAFVLRSRLGPRYHHPVQLGDAQRAIRLLRARSSSWNLDPGRIGIMGFSAGGHLAMTASTMADAGNPGAQDPIDRVSSRPDFAILGYPVISMTQPWTHQSSKIALLGNDPEEALAAQVSGERAVTRDTPPTFLFHTDADTIVSAENSVHYYLALRRASVPAELHVFEKGEHGLGLASGDAAVSAWSALLANWLRERGIVEP